MNEIITTTGNTEIVESIAISEELLYKWESYVDVKPKSKETYSKAIRVFLQYLIDNDIKQPTREDIISWRDSLKETRKATTIQTYLTSVKLFFAWLEQEGIYKNVAEHIKGVKIDKGHKKDYLTSNQCKKVIASIDASTLKGLRDKAIVSLMLTTGLRTIEVVRANIEDMRVVGDYTALFIQGKGHDEKTDYVKLAPQVEDIIRDYLKARGEAQACDPLFTSTSRNNKGQRMTTRSISSIAKESLVDAGYNSDRLTAHSFRHTAGTLALMNGVELEQVQQMLRHTSINTTMIYMHSIERAKNDSELKVANAIF